MRSPIPSSCCSRTRSASPPSPRPRGWSRRSSACGRASPRPSRRWRIIGRTAACSTSSSAGWKGATSRRSSSATSTPSWRGRARRGPRPKRGPQSVQSLLTDGGALEASEEVLNSQLVQRLRERQVALSAQIAELSTTLLPGHPRIRALDGQVANLGEQIRQEAEKVLASLNTAARVAAARENSLVESLDAAKGDVSRSNDEEIELRALEREGGGAAGIAGIVPGALSRGGGAHRRELSAGRCPHHLARRSAARAVLPEEDDDGGGGGHRDAAVRFGYLADARIHLRPRLPGDRLRRPVFRGAPGGARSRGGAEHRPDLRGSAGACAGGDERPSPNSRSSPASAQDADASGRGGRSRQPKRRWKPTLRPQTTSHRFPHPMMSR